MCLLCCLELRMPFCMVSFTVELRKLLNLRKFSLISILSFVLKLQEMDDFLSVTGSFSSVFCLVSNASSSLSK